jgi:hypothetical protein
MRMQEAETINLCNKLLNPARKFPKPGNGKIAEAFNLRH